MKEYQICTKCVMDTTDKEIVFDENGVCNHCHEYQEVEKNYTRDPKKLQFLLNDKLELIRNVGKDKKYDCLIGVSGGVDSSYVAYLAKQWGLRALLFHFDNGWDSKLSADNLKNIIKYTGFDIYESKMDQEEFQDIQKAFFKADVVDVELVTDYAIFTSIYKVAKEFDIKIILSGVNNVTEKIMAKSWVWRKDDATNIKSIHKKYGTVELKTFRFIDQEEKPSIARSINILEFVEYDKSKAIEILRSHMDWSYYGGKHYESIFTRFYQGYILPKKFNIDKRRAHHSTLINSGQMTRDEALEDLKNDTYPKNIQEEDFNIVCDRLGFSREEMNDYLKRPAKSHLEYDSDYSHLRN